MKIKILSLITYIKIEVTSIFAESKVYIFIIILLGPEDAVRTSVRSIIQKNAKLSDADADLFMAKLVY